MEVPHTILMVGHTANVSYYLSKYLKRQGYAVERASFSFRKDVPVYIRKDGVKFLETHKAADIPKYVNQISKKYDVIHFFGCMDLNALCAILLKLRWKKEVIHCLGSDLRNLNLRSGNLKNTSWNLIKKTALRVVDKVIVTTPDLLSRFPKAKLIFAPLDLEFYRPFKTDLYDRLHQGVDYVLFHPATNPKLKGTHKVREAFKRLKKEYSVRLISTNKIPFHKMPEYYNAVDVVLGEFKYGALCYVSLEAMACKRPAVTYLKFWRWYSDKPPILSASTALEIYSSLTLLLDDPNLRNKLGEEGREFVKKYYDAEKIAKQVSEVYSKLFG